MAAAIVVQEPDIAARAQPAGAGAVKEHGCDLVVALPGIERSGQRADHRRAKGVECLETVKREPPERALAADEHLGHGEHPPGQLTGCVGTRNASTAAEGLAVAPTNTWGVRSRPTGDQEA